jgi:hypothetical protein
MLAGVVPTQITQQQLVAAGPQGHSFEARLYAENTRRNFLPGKCDWQNQGLNGRNMAAASQQPVMETRQKGDSPGMTHTVHTATCL